MINPYQSPNSANLSGSPQSPPSYWVVILAVALTIVAGMLYSTIYPVVPQFEEMFRGFGSELPWLTTFILQHYYWFGLPYLIGLVPCMILLKNRKTVIPKEKELFTLIVINFALAFCVTGLVAIAMYLPIFKMGEVV